MTEPLFVRGAGRAKAEYTLEVIGPLSVDDARALDTERGIQPSSIKKLHERHHALARMLAQGIPPGVAAAELGYDVSRVSILKGDPTFKELVQLYMAGEERQARDIAAKLNGITSDAMDALQDRLTDPEAVKDITTPQLAQIIEMGADRLGLGPQSLNTNLNIHVGLAEKMKAARERARDASRTIEGKAHPIAVGAKALSG